MDNVNGNAAGLAVIEPGQLPAATQTQVQLQANVETALATAAAISDLIKRGLTKEIDYGIIPGTPKPTLLKPGAEKLLILFNLGLGEPAINTGDLGDGHVEYEIRVPVIHRPSGVIVGYGTGSCNSRESKYIKTPPYNIRNTILKMAKKRALIDGALTTTGASGVFTQDVEDLRDNGVIASGPAASRGRSSAPKPSGDFNPPTQESIELELIDAKYYPATEKAGAKVSYTARLQSGATGYIDGWEDKLRELTGSTDPASLRGPCRAVLTSREYNNKTYYNIQQLKPLGMVIDDFETGELGEPLELEGPLGTAGN